MRSDLSIAVTDHYVGLRFASNVSGKTWEVVDIIAATEPLPTLIAVLVDYD
jgi:hypothetical protein